MDICYCIFLNTVASSYIFCLVMHLVIWFACNTPGWAVSLSITLQRRSEIQRRGILLFGCVLSAEFFFYLIPFCGYAIFEKRCLQKTDLVEEEINPDTSRANLKVKMPILGHLLLWDMLGFFSTL